MDFVNFRDAVAKNFVEMQNHQLIANKEQSALAEMPLDDLRKMVEAM